MAKPFVRSTDCCQVPLGMTNEPNEMRMSFDGINTLRSWLATLVDGRNWVTKKTKKEIVISDAGSRTPGC